MPKSPEPTTINSVLEDFDKFYRKETYPPSGTEIGAFIVEAISKTCDEILRSVPEMSLEEDNALNSADDFRRLEKNEAWNRCRSLVKFKVNEIKSL